MEQMNIIVPLSNENYYKLCLDNIYITNELICKTAEIVRLNKNTSEQINKSISYKIVIKKIIELIKSSNNIGIFDILINILPYPIWIEWFKSCFILKYYWNEELIKKIEDSNKMKINSLLLNLSNADFLNNNTFSISKENNLSELPNELAKLIDCHLINLTDSYDLDYNFTKEIIKKRISYFEDIFSEYFENFDLENYFGCDNFIFVLGLNKLFKNENYIEDDKKKIIKEKLKNSKIILTLYSKKKCSFRIKKNTLYLYDDDYIYLFPTQIIIKIHKKIFNRYNIFGISDGYIDFENLDLKVNATTYQKFNLYFDNIFKLINNQYDNIYKKIKTNNINTNDFGCDLLKAQEQTWFKSSIPIVVTKLIKYNLPKCYECKKTWDGYSLPDYKYHCLKCGIKNYKWKIETVKLEGMIFFITGIRVKIGFATTLRLLRSGATVIGTTRYPNFALYNYSKEPDYENFKSRLVIVQADFLNLDSVYGMLDILDHYKINGFINMAFRTIRPSEYYSDSVNQIETELKNNINLIEDDIQENNKLVKFKPNTKTYFTNLKQVDLSGIVQYEPNSKIIINRFNDVQEIPHQNSWEQSIEQIDPKEIVECVAINQLVPTLIINKIKSKLVGPNKFIIHVGSFEGQFDTFKNDKHIHTNMCKSALNMLIRSLEEDSDTELHVYTINPGYVTGVKINPLNQEYPLTMEDGASRITWPIFQIAKGIKLDKSWTKIGNYEKTKW